MVGKEFYAAVIYPKRVDVCQSGFHDQKLQRALVKVPVERFLFV
ncbi:MAG TPA: hypothetical protein VFH25_02700 [Nitrososphaeraceae archaeon]|nr:hypothetical protein [Nitrososphaeraceae archaeon]